MEISNYFKTLLDITNELSYQSYLVGGSVRDYLLKVDCYDYDFALKDKTIEIGKQLANQTNGSFFILDYERETVRIVWNLEGKIFNFDIAKIIGNSITEDLELRDLTINSIAINVTSENYENIINCQPIEDKYFIDPTNGIKDLKQGIIKTFKESNLTDDSLRMLRVFRFATKFSFSIHDLTLGYIQQSSEKIQNIARERILKELYDMFYFNNSNKYIKVMIENDLFKNIFSDKIFDFENQDKVYQMLEESENIQKNFDNHFKHFENIQKYLNEVIILNRRINECLKFSLIFSALKNDDLSINKYIIKLENFLKQFTFSVNEQKFIIRTVKYSLDLEDFNNLSFSRRDLYLFFKERKNETISSLIALYINSDFENRNKIKKILEIYFTDPILSYQPEIINGNQIMSHFNLKPGKIIGEILEKIKQAQAEQIIENYQQAIDYINKFL